MNSARHSGSVARLGAPRLEVPPTPLILLEFNELSPVLMDRFISQGHLPNFARLRHESSEYITDAGEDPPRLNPWIQWVTAHSGKPYAEHGVFHLGDAPASGIPMIWDTVCAAGYSAWVCGSMNISVQPGFKGWLLPDPWDASTTPIPESFEHYMKLVRAYVFEYTSGRRPATLGTIGRFVTFMLANGLSVATVSRVVRQLFQERIHDTSWKRASILDLLQFDLFRSVFRRNAPLLSILFYNSTAHYQHAYWRNMQPELFSIKPTAQEQNSKANAVLFGYQSMDQLVGKVLEMAADRVNIAFATALSQQPCVAWDESGGKTFYKPHDAAKLLNFAGIEPESCRVEPVMSEQFHLRFGNPEAATRAKAILDGVTLGDGCAVMGTRLEGNSIFTGCRIYADLPGGTRIRSGDREANFREHFYQVEGLKSGMHHRDGMLWIRGPDRSGRKVQGKVPLTSVKDLLLTAMNLA